MVPENHAFLVSKNELTDNLTLFCQYPNYTNEKKETDQNKILIFPANDDSNTKQYSILYKAFKNVPDCILLPMQHSGVIRTTNFFRANLIWKLLKPDRMEILIKNLNKFQRYNHFPCTWQIGRKDNLWRNYIVFRNRFGEEHFDYIPHTYILPEDSDAFNKKVLPVLKEKNESCFIMKPVASSRGRGIKLLTSNTLIPKKCIISHYISNPHIINKKKYDLRLYVLITGFSPLKIYLYSEGLVRFASDDYDATNLCNKFVHLTNYSINKESSKFDSNVSTNNQCIGSKWSLSALRVYFKANNLDFEELWTKIKDIVVKTVITIEKQTNEKTKSMINYKNCLFEQYGFDVLVDANLRPWLMEVNLNPSLNTDTELDMKIKSMLMTDIFNLIGLEPYSHCNDFQEPSFEVENLSHKRVKENEKQSHLSQIESRVNQEEIKLSLELKESDFPKEGKNTRQNEKRKQIDFFDTVLYSKSEFERAGKFERLFPVKSAIDYYSQFTDHNKINQLLWSSLDN